MLSSIYGISPSRLQELISKDFPAFRGRQLLKWIYEKMVFDLDKMSDLPPGFKSWLKETFDLGMPEIINRAISKDGTIKYLLKLSDGRMIESVLIPEGKKRTLCVSSQTGCARNCAFCATGTLGAGRDLLPHEILQQILIASHELMPERLSNIVFMGMGEPLDNLDNLLEALSILQEPAGLAFSPRRITVSTSGVAPGIIRLANSGVKVKLAVSLNSAIDSVRTSIMPINQLYPLARLKTALQYYKTQSSFRITFEYILIPGLNMDEASLKALRRYSGDIACKINFIPLNPVAGLDFRAPTKAEVEQFLAHATSLPQAITFRKSKGQDIQGACGQLALGAKLSQ